jgi:flagella basal body P-ring formation protein FlgA
VSWRKEQVEHVPNLSSASPAALKPKVVITMRAGAHATLLLDDDRSHIQIAVISLENGIAGHSIRVSTPDHKQVYVAEVVNASLLRKSY